MKLTSHTDPQHRSLRSSLFRIALAATQIAALFVGVVSSRGSDGARAAEPLAPVPGAGTSISGTVFHDYNANGVLNPLVTGYFGSAAPAADTGFESVVVAAYAANGSLAASTSSGVGGVYTLTGLVAGAAYRIEFLIPAGYSPTRAYSGTGVTSGTSVQFVTAGTSNVSFGLYKPQEYCQNVPDLVTPCYTNGPLSDSAVSTSTALRQFPYTAGDRYGSDQPASTSIASAGQVGAVYGVAVARNTGSVFVSAFMKRYAAFGPGGTGAIYRSLPYSSTAAATLFLDINALMGANAAGVDPHPSTWLTSSNDALSYDTVGKISLGDLEINEAEDTLYTVNLASRELLMMRVGAPQVAPTSVVAQGALPGPGQMGHFPIPAPCSNALVDARPFALGVNNGLVYVGGVCTGESAQIANSWTLTDSVNHGNVLSMYVYSFNPATGTFSGPVLQAPLSYPRKCALDADMNGACEFDATWRPWRSTLPEFKFSTDPTTSTVGLRNITPVFLGEVSYPEPWLADIEFDTDGAMILGLRDRFPDQVGFGSPAPTMMTAPITYYLFAGANSIQPARIIFGAGEELLWSADGAGDMLRACPISSTTWGLEWNSSCGGLSTAGFGNNEGPAGGSYYFHDDYTPESASAPLHDEVLLGALLSLPGFPETVVTVYDPYQPFSSGTKWFVNATGDLDRAYQLYVTGPSGATAFGQTFGKGNGLGDIEALCDQAPIEIGNRLWNDLDHDGVQDAGEPPLAGVTVSLYDVNGNLVATTVTAADGTYTFSSAGADGIPGTADDLLNAGPDGVPNTADDLNTVGLRPSTLGVVNTYTVMINNPANFAPGGPLYGFVPTVLTAGSSTVIDSNGTATGATTVSSGPIGVGAPGQNNHSIDFGFFAASAVSITKSVADDFSVTGGDDDIVVVGSAITYTLRITNTNPVTLASVIVTDTIPVGTVFLPGSAVPAQTSGPDPLLWNLGSMAPGASAVIRFNVMVLDSAGFIITNTARVNGIASNVVTNTRVIPTAVSMVAFTARREGAGVAINWLAGTEQNTLGYRLYRGFSPDRAAATALTPGLIAASGEALGGSYAWLDQAAPAATNVYYWLQVVSASGETQEFGPVFVTGGQRVFLPSLAR